MGIYIDLDVELAKRKMKLGELAEKVDLSIQNLSILKTGKAKAIRFSTLAKICQVLGCQPGDVIKYSQDPKVGVSSDAGHDANEETQDTINKM